MVLLAVLFLAADVSTACTGYWFVAATVVTYLIAAAIVHKNKFFCYFGIFFTFCIYCAFMTAQSENSSMIDMYNKTQAVITGTVSRINNTGYGKSITLKECEIKTEYGNSNENVIVYVNNDEVFIKEGFVIEVSGSIRKFEKARNEGMFDAYTYYKSRIPLGCEEGSDVITSYDNKYTMFVTKRGFVAMSYQDFISSEEQALTFLSDTIYDVFSNWNKGAIKLFQYNFWIILYRPGTADAFVFDMRSNSWWPVAYNSNVVKLIEINRIPLILKGQYLYQFDKSNNNYFDGDSIETGRIDWHITSQKLHLNAINYYKHIINLTFFGYNYDDKQAEMRFNLRIINYRKQTDTNEQKSFEEVEYKIQLTRTFVKRINYYKVNQVQYVLESCRDIDEEDKTPIPLSLTCISLKYLITGQVR